MKVMFASQFVTKPLADLVDSRFQRNKHSDEQIERLAKIMKEEGVTHPIFIVKGTNEICFGHGRKASAILNGWSEFPTCEVTFENDDQIYRMVQSDNAIASWAELDLAAINADLPNIGPFDIELLGIKDFEVEPADKYGDKDADAVPEVKESFVKSGELWLLGNHRLLCGDCTKKEDVERLMNGERADMVYTDPPYGMNLDTEFDSMFKSDSSHVKTGNRFKKVQDDDKPFDPAHLLAFDCQKFIWGCDYFYSRLPDGGSFVAWDKRNENLDAVPGNTTEFCWAYPPVRRMTCRVLWSGHHGMQKDDSKTRVHPTQKPTALHEWFFERWGKDKTNIVDLYGGSGSTLIACEKQNKKCFMAEIDEHYVSVILERWAKFTSKDPIRESDGLPLSEIKKLQVD
jgi:16S rRNA G966 N2-methylase RsmD